MALGGLPLDENASRKEDQAAEEDMDGLSASGEGRLSNEGSASDSYRSSASPSSSSSSPRSATSSFSSPGSPSSTASSYERKKHDGGKKQWCIPPPAIPSWSCGLCYPSRKAVGISLLVLGPVLIALGIGA